MKNSEGKTEFKPSPRNTAWRETLKNSPSLPGGRVRGTLEVKTSPCGGEDITPTGINKVPPHGVTGVGEGRA